MPVLQFAVELLGLLAVLVPEEKSSGADIVRDGIFHAIVADHRHGDSSDDLRNTALWRLGMPYGCS